MSAALAVITALPELLKQGLIVYEKLKTEMEKAIGLKEYATNLHQINQVMGGVRKFLNEKEKGVADILDDAHKLTQKGLQKAIIVVDIIKSQSEALLGVLNPSNATETEEQMNSLYLACMYFAQFAKDIEAKVCEAENELLEASNKLYSARSEIETITATLKRVQDGVLDKAKEAIAHQRAIQYGGAIIGFIAGPMGLMIAVGIMAVTEGFTVKHLEKTFQEQRKKIGEYIQSFNKMKDDTESLQKSVDEKRVALLDIHGKLYTTSSEAKLKWDIIKSVAPQHFRAIYESAKNLYDACNAFLKSVII